jgi:tetratricopeptide (TPR) repeat protein
MLLRRTERGLATVAVLLASACSSTTNTSVVGLPVVNRDIAAAKRAYEGASYQRAARLYDRAIRGYSASVPVPAYLQRLNIYRRSREYYDALELLERQALRVHPHSERLKFERVRFLMLVRKWPEAMVEAGDLPSSRFPVLHLYRAKYYRERDPVRAAIHLEAYLRAAPRGPLHYYWQQVLATLHMRAKQCAAAREQYDWIAWNTGRSRVRAAAFAGICAATVCAKTYQRAIKICSGAASKFGGTQPGIWYNLAVSYLELGKRNEALASIQRYLSLRPGPRGLALKTRILKARAAPAKPHSLENRVETEPP